MKPAIASGHATAGETAEASGSALLVTARTEPNEVQEAQASDTLEQRIEQLRAARLASYKAADLTRIEVRGQLAAMHPMLESEFIVDTDITDEFFDIVYDYAYARKSGLYVCGEYRVGKTTAIRRARQRLRDDLPWLGVVAYQATRSRRRTKKEFCREILHRAKYNGPLADPVATLERFLMTQAAHAGSMSVLLFIDEAQMLAVTDLRYLHEIWNGLRESGFVLITVLVGQMELEALKQLTSEEDYKAVEARFLVKRYIVGGMRNLDQLRKYLRAFDASLQYPLDSGWYFSKFFRCQAFDAGWRLEQEAPLLWQTLIEVTHADAKRIKSVGFRIAFINDAIFSFLLDGMKDDKPGFKGSPELWSDSVLAAAEKDLFI